jgi:cell fate regulator YaaT (PSP1 superfamily)
MPKVVGLTFQGNGFIHYCSPGDLLLSEGDDVIVEGPDGYRLARVVLGPRDVSEEHVPLSLDSVVRQATEDDLLRDAANQRLITEAGPVVKRHIEQLGLPMKVVDITSSWDGGKLTVFFSADGRIDFRELIRELTGALGVRIHLYQVGARDHAKMLGGIGSCGLEICCATWMKVFEPVSMRMAKEQSLFLNPSKFSGNCGKLKCCLRYEYDFYSESHDEAIEIGAVVQTPQGPGKVVEINALRQTCTVMVPEVGRVEIRLVLDARPPGTPEHPEPGHGGSSEPTAG